MTATLRTPTVWAPIAREVEIEIVDARGSVIERHALVRRRSPVARLGSPTHRADTDGVDPGRGWWEAPEPLEPGTRYRYVVDGSIAPDPRSAFQPDGVHGSSVVIDHDSFPWTDGSWRADTLANAVIYELHVGTFTPEGTFGGVQARLDHLCALGVTHLELLPLATFDGHHGWGYDGVALFAPHHVYGTPDDLKALVDACHRRGVAVLLDVVYNHLGPVGNHLATFGPYFTDRYETPWGEAMNLDGAHSDGTRGLIIDNALMWLRDYHIDGLRLDAVHALLDTSATHILEELAGEVSQLAETVGRPLVLIAENDTNDPRLVRAPELGGLGLDALWCDDVHHAIHTVLTGESDGYYGDYLAARGFSVLADALRRGYVYDGRWSPARSRVVGRSVQGLAGRNLVVCIQNHDQVGNRARGERLHQLTSLAAQKVAAALILTAPFVPLLFQGEEWAASAPFPYFADHSDPQLIEAVREGRRREFAALGWDPDDVLDPEALETFTSARLDWDELGRGEHAEMLQWYRSLISLRRSTPDLLDDRLDRTAVSVDTAARTLTMSRGAITVLANLSHLTQRVDVDGTQLLASDGSDAGPPTKRTRELGPMAVAIYRRAPRRAGVGGSTGRG